MVFPCATEKEETVVVEEEEEEEERGVSIVSDQVVCLGMRGGGGTDKQTEGRERDDRLLMPRGSDTSPIEPTGNDKCPG